jgi:hypothetical protein
MFSDYIAFIDESGDHSLESIDPQYPIIRKLKLDTFGHDSVVLHEYEPSRTLSSSTLSSWRLRLCNLRNIQIHASWNSPVDALLE